MFYDRAAVSQNDTQSGDVYFTMGFIWDQTVFYQLQRIGYTMQPQIHWNVLFFPIWPENSQPNDEFQSINRYTRYQR